MLVQFRVENHRSLRDEQILSMVASGDRDDPRLIVPERLGESLLPVVALYGANASGKTNVLHALSFMCHAVLRSHRDWEPGGSTPREAFALSEKIAEASLFEVDIVVDGTRYRYGFVLGAGGVQEEWLTAWPKGRKQVWFEREGDAFKFGKHLIGENETIKNVTRANSLFLSAATQNNHAQLSRVYHWFSAADFDFERASPSVAAQAVEGAALFSGPGQASLFAVEDAQAKSESILRMLCAADLGILDIKFERPTRPNQRRGRGSPELLLLHRTADGKGAWLPLEVESAGTVTLLGMALRVVDVLHRGALLCIDELEASLHPMLALELLRLFQDRKHNPRGAQLIFTTHDTNLLGNVLGEPPLRRDQIWFTEKDDAGATRLYPLTDFHPRKDENLERGYLQGRYGAIPFLGELVAATGEGED